MEQPKMQRLLRIMMLLTGNVNYRISEIAEKIDTTERTVYRYIETFREAGFVIKQRNGIPKIDKKSTYFKEISTLIHFTEEEAYNLKSSIESIDENNLIKQNLKKKLYSVYNYNILADTVVKTQNAQNVKLLVEAMENNVQVYLSNYVSANSNNISTRVVEPFAFTTNYIQVWAYEIESKRNKLFKTSRIGKVILLNNTQENTACHKKGHMDVFRISSDKLLPVQLKLSLRAKNLLVEEYPLAEKGLTYEEDNKWVLKTTVCSYEGIGRFVLGLLHEIELIDSPDFKDFLRNRMQKTIKKLSLT